MVMVTRMKVRVCRRDGQVTYRKFCQFEAPSSDDASYRSPGMVCSPDSQMTMWKPTACQIDISMIAPSAVVGLPSQSVPWMAPPDTARSTELISPSGWYMNCHSMETTTIEVTTGRKYTVR